jgi:hypothetical protein
MGTRNKERRRAKHQRREARNRQRNAWAGQRFGGSFGLPPELAVDVLVIGAAHAGCEGRDARAEVAKLADRKAGPGWCALVTQRARLALVENVVSALHGGWEPRDVHAVVRRKVSLAAAALTTAVLPEAVRERRPDGSRASRWEAQLADLAPDGHPLDVASATWEDDMAAAVAAIGYLAHLGSLPDLFWPTRRPLPAGVGPGLLDRARALLAKAESTAFEEEADAFLAKAQELMTRHNLDRAALEEPGEGVEGVEARRCWLDDPYLKQKGYLLAVVAQANRCKTVAVEEYGFVTIFGHPDDISATEALFTSLLAHATKQMTSAGRPGRPARAFELENLFSQAGSGPEPNEQLREFLLGRPSSSRPSYRRSFLIAYANRIGTRLREAALAATEAAVQSSAGALLPVLANRERGVDEAVRKMFPETSPLELSVTDRAGWAAGQAAADLAELSLSPVLTRARS